MSKLLIAVALGALASSAFADCPKKETISAFGHTFTGHGLMGDGSNRDCDASDEMAWHVKIDASSEPAWLVKIDEGPRACKVIPAGLIYCRKLAQNTGQQNDDQLRDCVFWYGQSIKVNQPEPECAPAHKTSRRGGGAPDKTAANAP